MEMHLNTGILLLLFILGNEAMSLAGERNEMRSTMEKFPSLLDLIQRRLNQRQGQNSAEETQTKLVRDVVQVLVQNSNRHKRYCWQWWCASDRATQTAATGTTTIKTTTEPSTSSSPNYYGFFRALLRRLFGWLG